MKKKKPKIASKKKAKPAKIRIKKKTRIEKLEAVVSELAIRLAALEATLNALAEKQKVTYPTNPYPWPMNPAPTWKEWPIYYNYCKKTYS